ncbi:MULTISPECIES: glycoside hydrolase family 108 protein [unclassified Rhizobium]|uniref:glycoside hydrolase family 108 protein n=1 Tax=unclassified Rhizobium TaxID=2613769 RepID=UPI00160C7FE7|nr:MULTISPECIES: glycoside hydrolase family 108 protein [unclassified Rhizobium]MBB3288148.1 lysozyme family protein [Rhizobium sp. BK252]MBB3402988.1 lysozyme family protein [Rhizobium sp. BK289]MBB3415565.1 lysozyme family protein [Rhizobium sp. BK284]MBB3483354.1 lysozyme family protein [Rhizobium sp. BK347]
MDDFARSLAKVLISEGGFTNNPNDPGGATNKGITQRVYNEYRTAKGLPTQSVKLINDNEVSDIYRSRYWDLASCGKLRSGVSYVLFDGTVNSGVSQAVKWLQRALKQLGLYQGAIDGLCGQGTILAAGGVNDDDSLIKIIMERRLAFLKALKTWKYFGKGWSSRCAAVLKTGQVWASGSVGPDPAFSFVEGGQAKAFISDAKAAPVLAIADGTTGSGFAGAGVTGYIASAKDQLSQYAGSSTFIDHALMWMTVASIALVGGGAAYRWYAKRVQNKRADVLDLPTIAQAAGAQSPEAVAA